MKLRRFEARWLLAIFATILPEAEGIPGAARAPLDRFVDDLCAAAPGRLVVGLRLALWFVVWLAPLFTLWWPRRFIGLGQDDRLRVLHALRSSRFYLIRELPVLLKSVACLGHCGLPDVQRAIGLPADAEPPAWARP
jgi:hypothetical protein